MAINQEHVNKLLAVDKVRELAGTLRELADWLVVVWPPVSANDTAELLQVIKQTSKLLGSANGNKCDTLIRDRNADQMALTRALAALLLCVAQRGEEEIGDALAELAYYSVTGRTPQRPVEWTYKDIRNEDALNN